RLAKSGRGAAQPARTGGGVKGLSRSHIYRRPISHGIIVNMDSRSATRRVAAVAAASQDDGVLHETVALCSTFTPGSQHAGRAEATHTPTGTPRVWDHYPSSQPSRGATLTAGRPSESVAVIAGNLEFSP